MPKLSKEQGEEALEMRKDGESWRGIESKLEEKYGEEETPSFPYIQQKIKPVMEGEKTLEETLEEPISRGGKKENEEKEKKSSEDVDLDEEEWEVESKDSESKDGNGKLVALLWILVIIAVIVAFMIT